MEENQKINKIYEKIIEIADALNSGLDKNYYDVSEKETKEDLKQKLEDLQFNIKENNATNTINEVKEQIEALQKVITTLNVQVATQPTGDTQIILDDVLNNLNKIFPPINEFTKANKQSNDNPQENYFYILDNLYSDVKSKSLFFKVEYTISLLVAITICVGGGFLMYDNIMIGFVKPNRVDTYLFLIPRTAFWLFLELTALIFFQHANRTLNFLQFMNNEMTTIKFKKVALLTALASNDKEAIRHVIAELAHTDRNVYLKQKEDATQPTNEFQQNVAGMVKKVIKV